MKKLFLLFAATTLFACNNEKQIADSGFELKGELKNGSGEKVYLEELMPEGIKVVDTSVINDKGEFLFKKTPQVGFYNVKISDRNFATIILNPKEKVKIKGDAKDLGNTYTVEGSEDSKLFWELNKTSEKNYKERDSIARIFQVYANTGKDSVKIQSLRADLEKSLMTLIEKHDQYIINFIDKNPSSLASLAAIQQLDPGKHLALFEKMDKAMGEKYPTSPYYKTFHEKYLQKKKEVSTTQSGAVAPEITMNDPNGKPISLSSLRGKVVLIDFWSSWCAPCRAENPNVVAQYNKYKDKGFEIFAVSLDRSKEQWIKAIEKDKLTWIHVSDLQEWESPVVNQYGFNGIPFSVLIDKEGKIIAKGLRGESLAIKLEQVFSK